MVLFEMQWSRKVSLRGGLLSGGPNEQRTKAGEDTLENSGYKDPGAGVCFEEEQGDNMTRMPRQVEHEAGQISRGYTMKAM